MLEEFKKRGIVTEYPGATRRAQGNVTPSRIMLDLDRTAVTPHPELDGSIHENKVRFQQGGGKFRKRRAV